MRSVVQAAAAALDAALGSHTITGVSYGTDASKISLAGIPSIVLGPGDIAQAHTVDEWISVEQLERAVEVYYQVLLQAT